MIFWKSWFDVRGRFAVAAALLLLSVVPQSIFVAARDPSTQAQSAEVAEALANLRAAQQRAGEAESQSEWFRTREWDQLVTYWYRAEGMLVALLTVLLAVGGTMTEGHARSNLFTLSLPRRRRSWIVAQAGMAAGLVAGLMLAVAIFFVSVGVVFGETIPFRVILGGTATHTLGAWVWIGPSLFSTSLTRDSVKAGLLVAIVLLVVGALGSIQPVHRWSPSAIADLRVWDNGAPWPALGFGALLAIVTVWGALRRFRRRDY